MVWIMGSNSVSMVLMGRRRGILLSRAWPMAKKWKCLAATEQGTRAVEHQESRVIARFDKVIASQFGPLRAPLEAG